MKKESGAIGIVLLVIVAIIVIIAIALIGSYNGLVSKKETVESTLANLDVALQRRADLIPNLVNTVKGYTSHETEIIEKITTARENLVNANTVEDKANADNQLSKQLSALMVVVENYPDLKSSENFRQLSDELAGTENRIAVARRDYNNEVRGFNTKIKKIPTSLIAGMFGFESYEYFQADEESTEVPSVNFQ